MKILQLSPMSPIAAITPFITARLDFVPTAASHREELGRHTVLTLPSLEEVVIAVNGRLLVPDFYEHCVEKIRAAGRVPKDSPFLSIARRMAAASPELIRSVKAGLGCETSSPDFSATMMQVLATWRGLMVPVRMAYPEIDALAPEVTEQFFGEEKPNKKMSLPDYLGRADEVWKTFDLFSGGIGAKIRAFRPDVVFLKGWCPVNLPFFVAAAKAIKAVNPHALVFIRHAGGLLNANVQYKDWFLANPALFDLVDGVLMFTDVSDLTAHEIIRGLRTSGDFRGIANLAHRRDGQVVFEEPRRAEVEEYLLEATLALPPGFSYRSPGKAGLTGPNGLLLPAPRVVMASLLATKQACYWYKCNFCDINRQNLVLKDPHLERRGEEVAQLLLDLRGNDIDFAFVDSPAIPPLVLEGLASRLEGETGLLPWGYEARFDPALTEDFIARLSRAGCVGAIFGLETAIERVNRLMNKYPDEMNLTRIQRIIDGFDKNGMMVHVNTIVNLPGMTQEEFGEHSRWLHANLEKHRLFHFNTNSFVLRRDTGIARRPEDFGIALEPSGDAGEGYDHLPFSYLPGVPRVTSDDSEIYKECFGFDRLWGVTVFVMHGAYHERLMLSFFDAVHGQNLFKWLTPRLGNVANVKAARICLPESVSVEEDAEGIFVTLVETRALGTYAVVPREVWAQIETLLKSGETVGPALRDVLPGAAEAEALETVKGLVADGLLEAVF